MSGGRETGFSPVAVGWIAGVAVVSFLLAFVLAAFGDDLAGPESSGPDSFSYSALGHRAFVEFLEQSGLVVRVRRDPRDESFGPHMPLILAEPPPRQISPRSSPGKLRESAARAGGAVFVVLPKWEGTPQPLNSAWLDEIRPVPTDRVEMTLGLLLPEAVKHAVEIERRAGLQELSCSRHDEGSFTVILDTPQFVIPGPSFEPLVTCGDDVLLARGRGESPVPGLHLIADPDLINNHGLARGDHARMILELFEGDIGVVLDETAHGFVRNRGLVAELLRFPLVLVVLHGLLLVGLVAWAGSGRFGKPRVPAPRTARGRQALIDNVAQLLSFGGHSALSLKRYFNQTLRTVGAHYFLPPDLTRERLLEDLQAISERRGARIGLSDLDLRIDRLGKARTLTADRAVRLAARVHRWREEMIDADRRDP